MSLFSLPHIEPQALGALPLKGILVGGKLRVVVRFSATGRGRWEVIEFGELKASARRVDLYSCIVRCKSRTARGDRVWWTDSPCSTSGSLFLCWCLLVVGHAVVCFMKLCILLSGM
ncbi:uncharacterized protein LOC110006615 [Amborella trichopoda]|uniref:uncharacterized protein LOC110006615 n=1 Tax=Amborella trichopoda TaxID=13333 RepID=UPI0009BD731B|nr:uncharacterized protein LOC110006615 [Amborella trichopoda]|eukprot:XP_020518374.1 uncharacterized protein LOC110006615 [Amborella trichopoda]